MINAIAELGRYEKEQNPGMKDFDIWLEDSYDNGKYDTVFLIVLERSTPDSLWQYASLDVVENSGTLKNKLIYKRGSSRGTDITATAKVAGSIAKTFRQKILAWFSSNKDTDFLDDSQKEYLNNIHESLTSAESRIIEDLENKQRQSDCKGIVLSLKLKEGADEKYIGDIDFLSGFITQKSKIAYKHSKTFKKFSFSKDKICAVCKQEKSEVFGYFTSLGFYTVDKPGMVAGGFNQSDTWKNYPICIDCALDIETGIKFKEKHLDFRFYGFRYYLLPTLIHDAGKADIIEAISELNKQQKINQKSKTSTLNREEDVLEELKDFGNYVHFNLLFYDKPNKGVFRIVENIEEVFPSRINTLYQAKSYVDEFFIFKVPENKDGEKIYRFSFKILRDFFPREKIRGDHDKYFLQITRKIFSGMPVKYNFLLSYIMRAIRHRFANNETIRYRALSGFMLLLYLAKLNILTPGKGVKNMSLEFYNGFQIKKEDSFEEKAEYFFENFADFFSAPSLKAIFLMGTLTQFLLNIQSNKREGATPFRSQLKGLKMNHNDITGLLPKIIDKLDQYGSNYYKPIEKLISKYFVMAGPQSGWNLTVDEMNYVFVLGMNLSEYFNPYKEK